MARVADASVRNHRNSTRVRIRRHGIHGERAWGRPQAHTTCVVQMEPTPMPTRKPSTPASMRCFALLARDDVATNDLEQGIRRLDPPDHVLLEARVALRRVEDDDVDARLHQSC